MSLGEIDTYNLTFDKLQALFTDTQGYYESFLDANNLYKSGQMSDKEFFQKLGDYTASYSALLFLGVNSLMELKKALDQVSRGGGAGTGATHSPGLMPGMGQPGMGQPGMMPSAPPRGSAQNPVGGPPSVMVHLLQLLHLMNQELYLHQILDYFHQNKVVEIVHHAVQN